MNALFNPGGHLAAPALDHRQAKARALAVLAGGDPLICGRQAFDTLAERNRELAAGDAGSSRAIREALADQVAILEAVAAAYTVKAAETRNTDRARHLQGVAIRASQALTATLMALHKTTEDSRDAAALPGLD